MNNAIRVRERTGAFAEDKDVARAIRLNEVEPALKAGESVTIDFTDVPLTTQSFVHAMLSATIRSKGADVLEQIQFKGCSPAVKTLIKLVCEYSQETDADRLEDRSARRGVVGSPGRARKKK